MAERKPHEPRFLHPERVQMAADLVSIANAEGEADALCLAVRVSVPFLSASWLRKLATWLGVSDAGGGEDALCLAAQAAAVGLPPERLRKLALWLAEVIREGDPEA